MVGGHAEERHRRKDPEGEVALPRLSQCRREVVVPARVMGDMVGPQQPSLVLEPMGPVIEEVPGDERGGERHLRVGEGDAPLVVELPHEGAVDAGERKADRHVAGQHQQARAGVVTLIADGHEWIGRQRWIGELVEGCMIEITHVARLPLLQHLGLPQHRGDEDGARGEVDLVERECPLVHVASLAAYSGRWPSGRRVRT